MLQPPSAIDTIAPLLRLVNEREDLFFQLYSFVHKNIECSSNDLDNTTLFRQFLPPFKLNHSALRDQEQQLIAELSDLWGESGSVDLTLKDIERLSIRICDRLDLSLSRTGKGLFDQGGRSIRQFQRFKIALHKKIKKQPFLLSEYAQLVINHTNSKFTKQLSKIEKYIDKVVQGDTVFLKDLYKKGSDVDASSPDEKDKKKPHSKLKRTHLNLKVEGHHVEEEKKPRRQLKSTVKKRQKLQSTRHKPKGQSDSQEEKPNREQTGNKLYKFYEALALNKKQFLEDYIFKQEEKERKQTQLMNKLLERNKAIKSQINCYVKKTPHHMSFSVINMPPPAYFSKSSGEETSKEPLTSKPSEKPKQFKINRRRGSLHFQSSSGGEKASDHERQINLSISKKPQNSNRKSSHSQSRTPRPQQKSRKLVVIKQTKVFDDQMIPQAQINEPHFLQLPNALRKDRRNDIRLKRKNNPSPLENATFEHFRYNP